MTFSEIALILRWVVALWALGWLVLPISARLFPFLPDRGLAVGRILAIALTSLICFFGAGIHIVPLNVGCLLLVALPLLIATQWKKGSFRAEIAPSKRAFILSDAIFLLAFGAFLLVRLRHPAIDDLEKPMDMALLSAAMRATWLPFQNPWFAGENLTNYYYFGPLMGSLVARLLLSPPHFAYNLVQPMMCAFFLSATWSLCSALSKSAKIGVIAMLLVCVGGHFEPLRQISQTHSVWPLDYWSTSRVIEKGQGQTGLPGSQTITINEYPAFTCLIGDLHAHFYALSLAVVFFSICLGILKAQAIRVRSCFIVLGGLMLSIFAITNTWDTLLYGLLWAGTMMWSHRTTKWVFCNYRALVTSLVLMPIVVAPYFLRFVPQVSGAKFNPWVPDLFSFALLWGGWGMLALIAWALGRGEETLSTEAIFRRLLMGIGVIALLFPYFIYIRGVFGDGDLRYQDTVFKFGLQAWLLLGVGIASEIGFRLKAWLRDAKALDWSLVTVGGGAYLVIMALAPASVVWARANRDAPRDADGRIPFSLDAASYLPPTDRDGIEWLRLNSNSNDKVIEAVKTEPNGSFGGDYDPTHGRVSAFSGVPCIAGWPGHISAWGSPQDQIQRRGLLVRSIYSDPKALIELRQLGATYLFLGANEVKLPDGKDLQTAWKSPDGATQIMRLTG